MVLLRWLGWLWIASGVAAVALGLEDSGLLDDTLDPDGIAGLVGSLAAGIVPGLILLAVSPRGKRPRGPGRYHELARRNEAELARIARPRKPSRAEPRGPLATDAPKDLESEPAPRVPTVAAERPVPRRRSVIER